MNWKNDTFALVQRMRAFLRDNKSKIARDLCDIQIIGGRGVYVVSDAL